jgi:hypothetical protein
MTTKITVVCHVTFSSLSACTNILEEHAACNYWAEGGGEKKNTPEAGSRLLSNAGTYLANNVAPHTRNQYSSVEWLSVNQGEKIGHHD